MLPTQSQHPSIIHLTLGTYIRGRSDGQSVLLKGIIAQVRFSFITLIVANFPRLIMACKIIFLSIGTSTILLYSVAHHGHTWDTQYLFFVFY